MSEGPQFPTQRTAGREAALRDLMVLDHQLDPAASTCRAVLKTPRRAATRPARVGGPDGADLGRWLPKEAGFSLQLGFVPSTRTDDGGPMHVLVLADRPSDQLVTGVRLIGVLEADHTEKGRTFRNDRLVAVAQDSRRFETVSEIGDLTEDLIRMLTEAWVGYNVARCASFQVVAARGAAHAVSLLERGAPEAGPRQVRSFLPTPEGREGTRA